MKPDFSTIVVPTDFSDHATYALRYAESLAREFGASLHLLHVVDLPVLSPVWGSELSTPDVPRVHAAALAEAEFRIADYRRALPTRGIQATAAVILGDAAHAIAEYASHLDADLIVMGTHGRTGLAHLAMGSVAEDVVRLASCPVLTIRARRRSVARHRESTRGAASNAA